MREAFRSFSNSTMLPMCGAITASLAFGLRPTCIHARPISCTNAHDRIERMMGISPRCPANFGISAVGHKVPLMRSRLRLLGVTPEIIFRSNVSTWLGPPSIRMKMTCLAVFLVTTCACATTSAASSCLVPSGRNDPVSPAPASLKNARRSQCGRRKKEMVRVRQNG